MRLFIRNLAGSLLASVFRGTPTASIRKRAGLLGHAMAELEERVVPTQAPTTSVTYVASSPVSVFNDDIAYAQNISGATVRFSSGFSPSEDRLLFTNPTGASITSSYDATNGILTLSGTASGTTWGSILQGVKYSNISADPSNGDRTLLFQLGLATYSPDTGHYYQFINTAGRPSLSWSSAVSDSSSRFDLGLQGYLATIGSQAEQDFVNSLDGGATVWLGGSDSASQTNWRWRTGPEGNQNGGQGLLFYFPVYDNGVFVTNSNNGQYNNWSSGYPLDSTGPDYLAATGANGQWITVASAYATTGYVVEFGGLGVNPSFYDRGYATVHVLDRTTTPTVTSPAAATAVNAPSYAITGVALANSLVGVYADANNDGVPDNPNSPLATQQLSGGATAYSINTPLTQDADNNFLVLATASSGANPSFAQDVPTITDDSHPTHLRLRAPAQVFSGGVWSVGVDALDVSNAIDPNDTGSVALGLSAGPAGGKLSGVTLAPVVNGTATFNNLTFNQSGTYALTASGLDDLPGVSSVVTVSATTHFDLISDSTDTAAGQGFLLTVTALNAQGQTDAGYRGTIHFSSADAHAGLPADYTFTAGDNGLRTFVVTLTTVGKQTISVADITKPAAKSVSEAVNVTPAPAQTLIVSGYPAVDVPGAAHPVTVTVVDAFGNRIADYRGTVRFTSGDSQAILPANYTFTAADNGTHKFNVTFKSTGAQSLTATDTVNSSITGTQSGIQVNSPTTHFRVTATPTTTTAGQSVSITVTALNALGQPDPLFRDTVHFSSTDTQAGLPANYAFLPGDNGSHTFTVTPKTAGSRTVTVADIARPTVKAGIGFVVKPAAASSFHVASYPASTVSGATHSVVVTALDAFGNRATDYRGTVNLTSSDALAVLATSHAFTAADSGAHTFTAALKTPGTQSLTATDAAVGALTGAQTGITVTPATTHFSVTGVPAKTTAGVAFTSVTVRALDALGHVDTLFQGTIHFTSTDPNAVLPVDYTFQPGDNGSKTVAVTFTNIGRQTITVTDTAKATIKGISPASVVSVTGTAPSVTASLAGPAVGVRGQPMTFTLSAGETGQPAGTVFTYKIDWDGNGTVDQTITGASGLTIIHAYAATGNFNAKVTAVGTTGKASVAAVTPVAIKAVALINNDLCIGGATGADVITVTPTGDISGRTLAVTINNVVQPGGPFIPTGQILIYSQAGADMVKLVAATINGQTVDVAVPAVIFGGAGNKNFSAAGSSANNVLIGGTGADQLTGGTGRDILIGGAGADILHAGTGDSLLISGKTAYDTNLAAWLALSAEWSRNLPYQERVQDLYGTHTGGLNGAFLLNSQTITRDTVPNQLFGGPANDWFWALRTKALADKLTGYASGEVETFE